MDAPRRTLRLIVQIPCLNEEETLPVTVAEIPRDVPGIAKVELLVVDDGSTDRTVEVAKACGVEHVVSHGTNKGLARAFQTGLDACLARGADIIVNTDADNQYKGEDIARLIEPILGGKADIVIGTRPIDAIEHFSPVKKVLQRLGSFVVRLASGVRVEDAPSGFRAFTREAALRLHVHNTHTYTLETIISAVGKGLRIRTVPIRVNGETRPSRLMRSMAQYIQRSMFVIVRSFFRFRGVFFFYALSALSALGALLTWAGDFPKAGWVTMTLVCLIAAVICESIEANRRLMEEILYRVRAAEADRAAEDGGDARDR